MSSVDSGAGVHTLGEFGRDTTFDDVRQALEGFAVARDWAQFHTPRNLVMALTGEVGELAELFQWKGDAGCPPGLGPWSETGTACRDSLTLSQRSSTLPSSPHASSCRACSLGRRTF
jgi:hypothetical protein